ncbi:MAG TPA: P1 family peptidase [Gaiellaceae bacterium]|nr:P1 family peptidase [Gaiellaceae bacterium]
MGAPEQRGPSLRKLGLRIGRFEAGEFNAITDVEGVTVGHVTVWRDEPDPPEGRGIARTGVTAIVPAPVETLHAEPVPAGTAVLNGAGELTGSVLISEWGRVETPVYLTSTHAVGRVYDGAISVAVAADPSVGAEDFVIPVVGECDDSWLSEGRLVQLEAEDAGRAVAAAAAGAVAEGAVGAGTGMTTKGYKAGIGTSSRIVPSLGGAVGVLVLSNFYPPPGLVMDGVPVGDLLGEPPAMRRSKAGSCIAVVAVDAPLSRHQLERVARRAGLGLARCGSIAHHGSGEIFVAFAPPGRRPRGEAPIATVPDRDLNDLFEAVVDATEESVLNALWAAPAVTGREGRIAPALPHDDVLALLDTHGRLAR